ncbi:MAG: hypothetical protein HQ568_01095 [Calditrichaeota bacterium]|nr:hypothetical protein [Calditrichota bacterium]
MGKKPSTNDSFNDLPAYKPQEPLDTSGTSSENIEDDPELAPEINNKGSDGCLIKRSKLHDVVSITLLLTLIFGWAFIIFYFGDVMKRSDNRMNILILIILYLLLWFGFGYAYVKVYTERYKFSEEVQMTIYMSYLLSSLITLIFVGLFFYIL